jgi:chromosome segregation ATPase
MRRLQSLRQCLPGRGLHHHGADRRRRSAHRQADRSGLRQLDDASEQSGPVNLEAGFREGYELGRLHHEKKREISSRESRIRSLENSIREDEKLLAAGTDDRRAVERRIDDNRRTIRDLDRDIGRMESDLRRIEDDMEDFRYRAAPLSQG